MGLGMYTLLFPLQINTHKFKCFFSANHIFVMLKHPLPLKQTKYLTQWKQKAAKNPDGMEVMQGCVSISNAFASCLIYL